MRLSRSMLRLAVIVAALSSAIAADFSGVAADSSAVGADSSAVSADQPTPPGQEEFVPLSEIPPEEQIPAFTLVGVAYAAVWIVLIGYVWSISKRLHAVESELTTLARKRG